MHSEQGKMLFGKYRLPDRVHANKHHPRSSVFWAQLPFGSCVEAMVSSTGKGRFSASKYHPTLTCLSHQCRSFTWIQTNAPRPQPTPVLLYRKQGHFASQAGQVASILNVLKPGNITTALLTCRELWENLKVTRAGFSPNISQWENHNLIGAPVSSIFSRTHHLAWRFRKATRRALKKTLSV